MTLALDPELVQPALAKPVRPAHRRTKDFETDAGAELVIWAAPAVVLALVLAVQTWGLAALTVFALCLVPLMFAFFIYICWPFRPAT